jgi:hypothetical protein
LELHQCSKHFRFLALLVLAAFWVLCLIPFHKTRLLPIPSVAALGKIGRIDFLNAYRSVKQAAAALARSYGQDFSIELDASM